MRSTRPEYPLVLSRRFTRFRVVIFGIAAGQSDFCDGFDSRQLHQKPLFRGIRIARNLHLHFVEHGGD
jgi:hypothetical protein